jgi:hypothetical protein
MEEPRFYNGKYIIEYNLHRKWFDMILSKFKKEEYRGWPKFMKFKRSGDSWLIKVPYKKEFVRPDECVLLFCNGYARSTSHFFAEFKEITYGQGNPEWGAAPGSNYFIHHIGEILEVITK